MRLTMRYLISGLFLFSALAVYAQDATQMAMQAAQQATQAADLANQQAMQDAQQANQQATQNAQQAQATTYCCSVAKPRFSVKGGTYPSAITLRMKDSTRGTYIYYTTDGWTPTTSSRRYTGPITLHSSATLQAIAVTADNTRSLVAVAVYTISGTSPKTVSTTFPANAPGYPLLIAGTPLPLVFTAAVASKGLQVGDPLPIALAQNLTIGTEVVASKLTPVSATVTQVDNGGINGQPGSLTFAVHFMKLKDGTTILLSGTETKAGQSHVRAAASASIIPLGGLFVHGKDALIPSGAGLIAHVRFATFDPAPGDAPDPGSRQQ